MNSTATQPDPLTPLAVTSPALFERVRREILGHSDAALARTKERLVEELEVDAVGLDAVLADQFALERCTCCGHWFTATDCAHDDGKRGYECRGCADEGASK